MGKKIISIVCSCFNEEENIDEFYRQVKEVMAPFENKYSYEQIFIDNASTDSSVRKIKALIEKDKRIRLIVNARNFGQVRSPYYGLLQANGDAAISMATDLQDPPGMLKNFIEKWEEGFKIVIGLKISSQESKILFLMRKIFYNLIARMSETEHIRNFSGFGLYDKQFLDILRGLDDPYPYLRGLIPEFGFSRIGISYTQPKRQRGKTKNNLYTLYDMAMLGFVNHSKVPLRLASLIGFAVAIFNILVALAYFIYKLIFWNNFQVGIAPLVIGIFFFAGVQLFFLGIIGEYIGAIFTQVKKRPLVIEKERVNF